MNPPSIRPSKRVPKSARSGEHPVVQAYRAKLESLAESTASATSKLDQELEEFLTELKTPMLPPKP